MDKLPAEILSAICEWIDDANSNTLAQCTLVCKSWSTAFQVKLYTNIYFDSATSLIKFNETISTGNWQLSRMVKSVRIDETKYPCSIGYHHVSTLLSAVPNLEHFHSTGFYKLLSNALKNHQLVKLKCLTDPSLHRLVVDLETYVECALLLKDRLDSVLITDGTFANTISSKTFIPDIYNHNLLSDVVHQFKKLKRVQYRRQSISPIQNIESLLNRCPLTVKKVDFFLFLVERMWFEARGRRYIWSEDAVPWAEQDVKSLYTPNGGINGCKFHFTGANGNNNKTLLLYIMHKLPGLKYLQLRIDQSPITVDDQFLEQYISFLSNINEIDTGEIKATVEQVLSNAGKYWGRRARLTRGDRLENVCIKYLDSAHGPLAGLAFASKLGVESKTVINLPEITEGPTQFNLMERFGEYISQLHIGYPSYQRKHLGAKNFIQHILKFCEKLERLTLLNVNIDYASKEDEIVERLLLDELIFLECNFGYYGISTLFGGVNTINCLKIISCSNNDVKSFFQVNLSKTNIDSLFFSLCDGEPNFVYVAITVGESTEYFYYNYDDNVMDDYIFRSTSKEDFKKALLCRGFFHLHLCCQSVKTIQVKCAGKISQIHFI